jgi:hypothetical protein
MRIVALSVYSLDVDARHRSAASAYGRCPPGLRALSLEVSVIGFTYDRRPDDHFYRGLCIVDRVPPDSFSERRSERPHHRLHPYARHPAIAEDDA